MSKELEKCHTVEYGNSMANAKVLECDMTVHHTTTGVQQSCVLLSLSMHPSATVTRDTVYCMDPCTLRKLNA
jgi:hypothetical protein